jgi:hypothetical protein
MTSGSELRVGINNILDKDPQAGEGLRRARLTGRAAQPRLQVVQAWIRSTA